MLPLPYQNMLRATPPMLGYSQLSAGNGDIADALSAAFEPGGLGLLLVRLDMEHCSSGAGSNRNHVLTAARRLAKAPEADQISIMKAADLGTDVSHKPGKPRNTFSASFQLPSNHMLNEESKCDTSSTGIDDPLTLRSNMEAVGSLLVHVAKLVAKSLDVHMLGDALLMKETLGPLSACLSRSAASKLRLIHYYSQDDTKLSVKPAAAKSSNKAAQQKTTARSDGAQERPDVTVMRAGDSNLASLADWQGWHYDYGLLTALTGPLHTASSSNSEDEAAVDVTEAVANGEISAGLVVLQSKKDASQQPVLVHIPSDCIAVQLGEAAQILSGGRLAATPHCVMRPRSQAMCSIAYGSDDHSRPIDAADDKGTVNPAPAGGAAGARGVCLSTLDRSTCVVFLQPHWEEGMTPALSAPDTTNADVNDADGGDVQRVLAASAASSAALEGLVPPLSRRWTPGASFAQFSKAVTQAYYGGGGKSRG